MNRHRMIFQFLVSREISPYHCLERKFCREAETKDTGPRDREDAPEGGRPLRPAPAPPPRPPTVSSSESGFFFSCISCLWRTI